MKKWMILAVLTLLTSDLAASQDSSKYSMASKNIDVILEGTDSIKVPKISFNSLEANWTFENSYYPIFLKNQDLGGYITAPINLSGTEIKLCVVSFDANRFTGEFKHPRPVKCRWAARLNNSATGNFKIGDVEDGLYNLFLFDEKNSSLLSVESLMVNFMNLSIDTKNKIMAGSPASVVIRTSDKPIGRKRLYVAVLVSEKKLNKTNIIIYKNNLTDALQFSIKIADRSLQMKSLPVISPDFFANLMNILPSDSAAAAIESNQSSSELFLLTDPLWEPGSYILTCAIFDIGVGLMERDQVIRLLGLKQINIEII
jgi:hypothetical protein